MNNEGLTPLDMLSMDVVRNISLIPIMPCQVYVWGTNLNYTLGTGTDDHKKIPECHEFFKRNFTSIKQVCMDEFHSVFTTTFHSAWVCGHGKRGRLGVGKEQSLVIPTEMLTKGEQCEQAAIAVDHTLILLSNGSVLSSGSNQYHQLGLTPYVESSNTLKYINLRNGKSIGIVTGIGAGKYHSIFYNSCGILVCGLNAGQLGAKIDNDDFITIPSQLSIQLKNNVSITHVATSNGAITYALNSGDIFVIHQFQFKRIVSKQNIIKLSCIGGQLHSDFIQDSGEQLKIAFLNSKGSVFVWQKDTNLLKCEFGIGRSLLIKDIHLNNNGLLLVSKRGEAYIASNRDANKRGPHISRPSFKDAKLYENFKPLLMSVVRIPNIHRAVAISSDPKGNNFSVIQTHPSNALIDVPKVRKKGFASELKILLDETSEQDNLHDLLINVKREVFPVHRYILASRGCSLAFHNEKVLKLDIEPMIFNELLQYIYTGECKLTNIDECSKSFLGLKENPITLLREVALNLGLDTLSKQLENIKYVDGKISASDHPRCEDIFFDRSLFQEFCDIKFISEDEQVFPAHKCILSASLEYFQRMFLAGWSESKNVPLIHLDCSALVVNQFLHYIYTKDFSDVVNSIDIEGLIRLLQISDQYLASQLKEECEFVLCTLLSLRNCTYILQVAYKYNAFQLKKSAFDFIALNLNAMIESRQLELLEPELLKELSDHYNGRIIVDFQKRRIVPCLCAHSEAFLSFVNNFPEECLELPKLDNTTGLEGKNIKGVNIQKKRTHRKSTSSTSPNTNDTLEQNMRCQVTPESPELFGDDYFNLNFLSIDSSPPKRKHLPKRLFPKMTKAKKKDLHELEEKKSPPLITPFKGWAVIPPPEVNKELSNKLFDTPRMSKEDGPSLSEVIAIEQQKRTKWLQMKAKPFQFTQMEDSAIDDLLNFYNADQVFDERISVSRVLSEEKDIPRPIWIH
ncbi:inhibitor of Bruton tyrosine kinase isoform X2 [Cimex lectularius]|nr:inhibitor of Bruton tyrosine kinase isoform X2 [Cimex lectularius]XP_014250305.1 inhibitor of Bruton tyrosine kinase isoform X2 [Cimex lectularius]